MACSKNPLVSALLVAALAAVGAGCKDSAAFDVDAGDGQGQGLYDVAPPIDATVTVLEPLPGGTFVPGDSVTFLIEIDGFALTPIVDNPVNVRGEGHARVSLDEVSGRVLGQSSETELTITLPLDIASGEHAFVVSLREKNGDPTGVEESVPFTFVGGIVAPDVTGGDATGDALLPDAGDLDAGGDTGEPDIATPDASVPDVATPDASVPDVATPDASVPDVATPDASVPDVAVPDALVPDIAAPDATLPDAAVPDAAVPDAAADASTGADADAAVDAGP